MGIRRMALLAVVPLAMSLAACGSDGGSDGVASGGKPAKGAAKSSSSPTMDPRDAQLKFAQCMRQNGIDVPDPEPGQKGFQFKGKKGEQAKSQAAMKKCEQYLQAGGLGKGPVDQKTRDQMVKYAQCMRQNGIDMPDPEPGKGLMLRVKPGTSEAKVEAAQKACEQLRPGGVPK